MTADRGPVPRQGGAPDLSQATLFGGLLEDSPEDLYEHAPCGYLSTLMDGQIVKINKTLLGWLGHTREQLVGRRRFSDLLTVGGRLYHETHFAPLLRMQGELGGVALEMRTAEGARLPVMVTSVLKTDDEGRPLLIRTTVFDARDRRAYERELLRARQEAERDRERLKRLVATLQCSLLPPVLPRVPGMEIAAHYHTASPDQVGGDFYDVFPLGDGRWGIFLGDVCGKGAGAAALTSLTRYTLRAAAAHDPDPIKVLRTLNTVLRQEYTDDDMRFCTVIFGLVVPDGDGFSVTLASGGHPPALLLGVGGGARYLETPDGLLIGVLAEARFGAVETRLRPGDTLMLYTDGLTEARTSGGRYGDEALLAFAGGLAPAAPAAIVAATAELLGTFGDGLDDDTALLALGVPAPPRDQV
ncbi:PP2C family protein-serine/threonine phosphatase [Streptosporangium sp. DT93]|uniref:PP2C family protein-serine/threonine phosphatase n=1 Tax=Streptosporangium sp. DT93 TaxID=3393428 RepID=UPI003CF8F479